MKSDAGMGAFSSMLENMNAVVAPSVSSIFSAWMIPAGETISVSRWMRRGSVTQVRQLERDPEIALAEKLDHRLQLVLLLAGDADLVALGL